MSKAPDKLLSAAELRALTGFAKAKIIKLFNGEWAVPGGAKMIGGEYRLPVSFYNRWVDSHDIKLAAKKEGNGNV